MKYVYSLPFLLMTALLNAGALSDEQVIQKGSDVSTALVQKLSSELKTQMQAGGPITALHYCSQNALSLTDKIAKESSTLIKRVSTNNRNPINAATTEEKAILEQWQTMLRNGEALPAYKLSRLSNGQNVYYKPIVINNEACLKCHGDIAADSLLGKAIKENYPEDKATGYKMGDLRGMMVISF